MRIVFALLLSASLVGAQEIRRFSFALTGDLPYSPAANGRQVYPAPAFERLIASINEDRRVDLTVHIGDIKAGDTRCEDEVYTKNKEYFETFRRALIFTPGDNEWTDCHRENNGTFNPVERLRFLRSVFFTSDESFGRRKIKLQVQDGYPENAIWTHGPVLFVTLHQPGSNNNRGRLAGEYPDLSDSEYTPRNAANMQWLDRAFELAAADVNNKGVVILSQANPFERFLETVTPPYAVSGYADFIAKLRDKVRTSGKQVMYVGGDTHYARVDKPLTATYPAPNQLTPAGARLMNFTRVEVYGQVDAHWTRVDVDIDNPQLFSFRTVVVPGN